MSNMFSVELSEVLDKYNPEGLERGEGGNETEQFTEQPKCRETEDWRGLGDVQTLRSDLGFCQDDNVEDGKLLSNFGSLADLYFDIDSPPFRLTQEEISKLANIQYNNVELIEPQVVEPVDIAKKRRSSFRQLTDETFGVVSDDASSTKVSGEKLSTNAILQLAGEKFIQSCSEIPNGLCHPYASSFLGHSDEEMRDVELVQCLLASAEKVGQKQFDSASKLLDSCDKLSSSEGNPVQRLVYYFSEALREKIDRETGTVASKGLGKKHSFDLIEALMSPTPTVIAFQKDLPFSQVIQFAGMQTMIENVADSRRVHMIDLEIRNGAHCVILMHALAARCECPIEHLKITAIGTKLKPKIEETGKWLTSFAQSMNLPFSFSVVMVQDMLDLTEDHFELYDDEAVAFYSPYALWSMIAQPDRLEHLLRVIRNTSPCVMVVSEIQAKLSSPLFVNRFIEALFMYGAFFDSVADCLAHDDSTRMVSESQYLSQGIRNILAAEGEERRMRKVSIHVWRAFFTRFGMVEMDLSMSSLYQAKLVAQRFPCGSSCTIDMDGKSLIIGWKRTPILSLSAWKFL